MKRWILCCATWIGMQGVVFAHEGHGAPGHGHTVTHYLLEPQHFPMIALTVLAVAGFVFLLFKLWKSKMQTARKNSSLFE